MRDLILRNLVMLTGAVVLASVLSACSSSNKPDRPDQSGSLEPQVEVDSSIGARQRGLELRVMTVNDAGDRVAQALTEFQSDLGPMDEFTREVWRDWGLRWIMVPTKKLDRVLSELTQTQAGQIRWMGEFPQWRPVIRTANIQNSSVRVGASGFARSRTLSGRPRLLARVWTTPELTDKGVVARLHLDAALQITEPAAGIAWKAPALPSVFDDGPLIDELQLSLLMDPEMSLVLVGEDPGIEWVQDAQTDAIEVDAPSDPTLGPSTPQVRTLGQQMLTSQGTGYVAPGMRYIAPKKVLIVFVPKSGGSYRLLGPTTTEQPTTKPGTGSALSQGGQP